MVLLDANILLELLLPDRLHQKQVSEWMESNTDQVCISMLTVHIVLHFASKFGLPKANLAHFLNAYIIQDFTASDYLDAMHHVKGDDYEDSLQLAVALRTGCTRIVTLDKNFAKAYRGVLNFCVIG